MWVNAMSEDTRNLTALQMLAQLNRAIEETGLHEMHKQRQPLEIFHNLLQDLYLSKELSLEGKDDGEIFRQLLKKNSLSALQKEVKRLYSEALELSTAHRTLTVWTRRELDQYFQTVQQLLEQGKHKKQSSG